MKPETFLSFFREGKLEKPKFESDGLERQIQLKSKRNPEVLSRLSHQAGGLRFRPLPDCTTRTGQTGNVDYEQQISARKRVGSTERHFVHEDKPENIEWTT